MRRLAASFLILCVIANGVDAAVDIADAFVGHGDTAHEEHNPHQGNSGGGGSGDDASKHFCHCAAHVPPLSAETGDDYPPVHHSAPDNVSRLLVGSRFPPPVRPPKP